MKAFSTLLSRILIIIMLNFSFTSSVSAGIPVIDASNVVQTTLSAASNAAQVSKQIQEYKTQLKEYENMLLNTVKPATDIWGLVDSTINDLMAAVDTLNYYKGLIGNIDAYLAKYKDLDYYRTSPCFVSGSCTLAEFELLKEGEVLGAEAQNKAYDALFKGIDKQQDKIKNDALELKAIQAGAKSATGRLEALGYANQLVAQQSRQMLQMRSVLAAQHTAWNTRMQVIADREARWAAAQERITKRLSPDVLPGGRNRLITEGF